jgi:hypothetical protein
MLHQHHRVVSFLDRLAVKVLRQLRQFGAGEIDANSYVLLRGREFVEICSCTNAWNFVLGVSFPLMAAGYRW